MIDKDQQIIDDYLTGKLNANAVNNDLLKTEDYLFQKQVVDGIKDYRSTQLKNRLDAVNINAGFFDFAKSSTFIKSFGGVILASLIGSGILIYGDQDSIEESILIDLPQKQAFNYVWNIDKVDVDFGEKPIIKNKVKLEEFISLKASDEVKSKIEVENSSSEFVPNVQLPSAISVNDDAPNISLLDKVEVISSSESEVSSIEVETKHTDDLNIQYKYYDGKLYLSGDFDKAPYEIIEINSSSSRRIYIKYLNKYYKVDITDKLTDLPEIYNADVIKELELLKAAK